MEVDDVTTPDVISAGTFVVKRIFNEFSKQVERKIDAVVNDNLNAKQILKSLQLGEDYRFDQTLNVLGCVAEHCLPSLFDAIMKWYDHQLHTIHLQYSTSQTGGGDVDVKNSSSSKHMNKSSSSSNSPADIPLHTREVAVKIIMCLALIKILQQLDVFPLSDEKIDEILTLCFTHFNTGVTSPTYDVITHHVIGDLFAEIVGVISITKFECVRKKFLNELKIMRTEDEKLALGLIVGMKFIRVKMYPVEEFESSFRFLRELADYFLEVKDREVKHALAGLFVEILIPVAAAVKTEVNVPILREFVDTLYPTTLELSKRKKNHQAIYPLITCLLCISQKQFFLNNWHLFLDNCLSYLKHRDPAVSRIALDSLYRLLWTYTVRIKCESNIATQSKLQSIIKMLFPVGSRNVVPKDTPLSIYVKIIQFIAQERLDFAMREIIFDLIPINNTSMLKTPKSLTLHPERINIGLRAFLVITDSLQQKDGAPPMPSTISVFPSGNTVRVKKTFLNKMLTDEEARQLGVLQYHKPVQKALDAVLQALDNQVGQRMIMTNTTVSQRGLDIVNLENKPKVELFRTCVATMPRLIPTGLLDFVDIFELLSRMTIHVDQELRMLSLKSLQLFIQDFPNKREDVIAIFVSFILNKVTDVFPEFLETSVKHLIQLLQTWTCKVTAGSDENHNNFKPLIHRVEAFALTLLCNNKNSLLKIAYLLLKEVKSLALVLIDNYEVETSCINSINHLIYPVVCDVIMECKPGSEISQMDSIRMKSVAKHGDLGLFVDYLSQKHKENNSMELWRSVIGCLMKSYYLPSSIPQVVDYSWYDVTTRQRQLWLLVDPNSNKKTSSSSNGNVLLNTYISLWTNYQVFLCSVAPSTFSICKRQNTQSIPAGTADWLVAYMKLCNSLETSTCLMFQNIIPLLRHESSLRQLVAVGLGSTSKHGLADLMKELLPEIRESCKMVKQENLRRKRKRDLIRLMIAHILEKLARHKILSEGIEVGVQTTQQSTSIEQIIKDYIRDTCAYLESIEKSDAANQQQQQQQHNNVLPTMTSFLSSSPSNSFNTSSNSNTSSPVHSSPTSNLRFHFASMLFNFIKHLPSDYQMKFLNTQLRKRLFLLFGKWCSKYISNKHEMTLSDPKRSLLDIISLKSQCSILCCAPVFDMSALQCGGYLYPWLESLLDCNKGDVHDIGKETIIMLLYHNPREEYLLEWLLDKCYTSNNQLSYGCFHSIVALYSHMSMKFDIASILNLAIYFLSIEETSKTSQLLLFIINTRYNKEIEEDLLKLYQSSIMEISTKLSQIYCKYNIHTLSEIFRRFVSTCMSGQRNMLHYVLPWLHNIHLTLDADDVMMGSCRRHEHTLFVLSNLTYITCKYWHLFSSLIADCWRSLCEKIPANLDVVLVYVTGLLASKVTPQLTRAAKIILSCVGKTKEQRKSLQKYLFTECQMASLPLYDVTVLPTSPCLEITRLEGCSDVCTTTDEVITTSSITTPTISSCSTSPSRESPRRMRTSMTSPLYTMTSSRKPMHHKSLQFLPCEQTATSNVRLKKISMSILSLPSTIQQQHTSPTTTSTNQMFNFNQIDEERLLVTEDGEVIEEKLADPNLFHLNLCECFEQDQSTSVVSNQQTTTTVLYRCNIACVLLSCLITEHGTNIELQSNMDVVIFSCLLGFDHQIVAQYCKLLLANVIVLMTSYRHQYELLPTLVMSNLHTNHLFNFFPSPTQQQQQENEIGNTEGKFEEICDGKSAGNYKEFFLKLFEKNSNESASVWENEDISSFNNMKLKSTEELNSFVVKLSQILQDLLPDMKLSEKLADKVINFTSVSTNQHYINRALQIYRALNMDMKTNHLCQIIRSLINHVTSTNNQSTVMEIFLTLHKASEKLVVMTSSNEDTRKLRKLNSDGKLKVTTANRLRHSRCRSGSVVVPKSLVDNLQGKTSNDAEFAKVLKNAFGSEKSATHERPSSYTPPTTNGTTTNGTTTNGTTTNGTTTNGTTTTQQQLRIPPVDNNNDNIDVLSQIFWVCQIMSTTEVEYQYNLSMKIIDLIFTTSRADIINDVVTKRREKLPIKQQQRCEMKDLQELVLKGMSLQSSYELSFQLLIRIIPLVDYSLVSRHNNKGEIFALLVITALPNLIVSFDEPDEICKKCADNISNVCSSKYQNFNKLQSLSHVMNLYSSNSYNKSTNVWVQAVCKYIYETFPNAIRQQLAFLQYMLEKGPPIFHLACLKVVYHLLSLSDLLKQTENCEFVFSVLHTVLQHVQGKHWDEAMSILKLCVERSSKFFDPNVDVMTSSSTSSGRLLPGLEMWFQWDVDENIQQINQSFVKNKKDNCDGIFKCWPLHGVREQLRVIHNNFVAMASNNMLTSSSINQHMPLQPIRSFSTDETENRMSDQQLTEIRQKEHEIREELDDDVTSGTTMTSQQETNSQLPGDEIDEFNFSGGDVMRDFDFLDEIEVDMDDHFRFPTTSPTATTKKPSSSKSSPAKKSSTSAGGKKKKKGGSDEVYDMTSIGVKLDEDDDDDKSVMTSSTSSRSSSSDMETTNDVITPSTSSISRSLSAAAAYDDDDDVDDVTDDDEDDDVVVTNNHINDMTSQNINKSKLEFQMEFSPSLTYIRSISPNPPEPYETQTLTRGDLRKPLRRNNIQMRHTCGGKYSTNPRPQSTNFDRCHQHVEDNRKSANNNNNNNNNNKPSWLQKLSSKPRSKSMTSSNITSPRMPNTRVVGIREVVTMTTIAASNNNNDDVIVSLVADEWLEMADELVNCSSDGGATPSGGRVLLKFEFLFNYICEEFCVFGRKCCKSVLGKKLPWLIQHFSSMLDNLPVQLKCPLCFISQDVSKKNFIFLQKSVKQLKDSLTSYFTEKSDAEACMVATEQHHVGDDIKQLCQHLYKLHYQLLMLFEHFNQVVRSIVATQPKKDDVTGKLVAIHNHLCEKEVVTSQWKHDNDDLQVELRSMTSEESFQLLHDLMTSQQWWKCLQYFHILRKIWTSSSTLYFGDPRDKPSVILTNIYFQCLHEHDALQMYAVIGENDCIMTSKLMKVNREIQHSLHLLDPTSLHDVIN